MSAMVLEYLESRLRACEAMIAEAADAQSRAIFEATRSRLVEEIEHVRDDDNHQRQAS